MAKPKKTPDDPRPLDHVELLLIARRAGEKLRKVFKRARRVCPPRDVLVARLVDSFTGLGSRMLAPQQGVGKKGRSDVARLGIVARRYFLEGDAIKDCDVGKHACNGRFHAPSETLKIWRAAVGPAPRRSTVRSLDDPSGRALRSAVRTAATARRTATLSPVQSAELLDALRKYERSESSGVGSWLAADEASGALSIIDEVERARILASSPVELWRPALYVFRRNVTWRWLVVKCRQVQRSALVLTDGRRWIAGFVSPAGAAPAPVVPPKPARAPWKPKTKTTPEGPSKKGPAGIRGGRRPSDPAPRSKNPRAAPEDPLAFLDDIVNEAKSESRRPNP